METTSAAKTFATLKILIITEWFLVIAAVILSFSLENTLPPLLGEWLDSEEERDLTTIEMITLLTFIPEVIAWIIASIGLFFRKMWAVRLYIGTWILLLFTSLFSGPAVEPPLTSVIGDCATLLGGIIIGIILFTDAIPQRQKEI